MIMLIALFSKIFELCMVDDDGDDLRWPEEEIQGGYTYVPPDSR